MNYLFGIFQRDGAPPDLTAMASLASAALNPRACPAQLWRGEQVALGVRVHPTTPEAEFETLPLVHPSGAFVMLAAARLDNRPELCDLFQIPLPQRAVTPDSALILCAYEKWGHACPDHLLGDWTMAVWSQREQELFLARDHHGNTTFHYYADPHRFVFASSLKSLLALPFVPRRPNELFVAKILTAWHPDGTETAYEHIFRLPPAHTLTVSAKAFTVQRYWFLENAPDIRYKRSEEYVDAFRAVYIRAVHDRLRANAPIAATLSGGLDSGSVCAIAARELGARGQTLTTYTSVPLTPVEDLMPPQRFADESPFVEQLRAHVQNLSVNYMRVEDTSPVAGLTRMLEIRREPGHGAGNHYWLVALLDRAQREGHHVLLTGQFGNATISWTGLATPALRHLLQGHPAQGTDALRRAYAETGLWRTLRTQFASPLLGPLHVRTQTRRSSAWRNYSAIHPAFAARLNLSQRMKEAGHDPTFRSPNDPRAARCAILHPGHSQLGALWQDNGAAFGLEARDPTSDKRVMEFCLGVPDDQYVQAGRDRLLIRRAMEGYLPDPVRLNPRRGRQAADLAYRLMQHRAEMDDALAKLRASTLVQTMLDLNSMQAVWNALQARIDTQTNLQSQTILTRGVMAGLHLLTFE